MVMECSQVNHAVNCGNMLLKSPLPKKNAFGGNEKWSQHNSQIMSKLKQNSVLGQHMSRLVTIMHYKRTAVFKMNWIIQLNTCI